MHKTIAVVTGASSGIGRRFAETLAASGRTFDEVWAIARREDRLLSLAAPCPVRALALDLTDRASLARYAALLERERPDVALLVNASGYGLFGASAELPLGGQMNMVDLNCQALLALCRLTLPHMAAGAQIINVASVAAFQPVPQLCAYAASKSFVLSYSRALGRELRPRGVRVLAVCPFWTRTEFFDRAEKRDGPPVVRRYLAMYEPEQIVRRAWRDAARGRDVSVYGFVARAQALLVKLLPHRLFIAAWMKLQGLG